MNLKSRIRYNKQIYIKLQFISRRLEGKSLKKKLLFCIYSINGGGSRGGSPPLFLDQRPEGPKKGFGGRAPRLSQGLDPAPIKLQV